METIKPMGIAVSPAVYRELTEAASEPEPQDRVWAGELPIDIPGYNYIEDIALCEDAVVGTIVGDGGLACRVRFVSK